MCVDYSLDIKTHKWTSGVKVMRNLNEIKYEVRWMEVGQMALFHVYRSAGFELTQHLQQAEL